MAPFAVRRPGAFRISNRLKTYRNLGRGRRGRVLRILAGAFLVAFLASLLVHFRVPEALPPGPASNELRVVTYNIRAGLGGIERITDDLRRLSADVIALQEVERGTRRIRRADQAQTLGEALEMEHAFASSFSVESGEHGLAILSRYPIRDVESLRLPRGSARWPRVALKARIDSPHGPFLLICAHLARPFGWPISNTRARLAQIRAIFDHLQDESLPVVLAGDFNSFPVSLEGIAINRNLRHAWRFWRDGPATTFPLSALGWPAGSIKIDHIFHDRRWKSRGNWVAPQGASDHRAVIADLIPNPPRT
jgi:endonuclease/exonuclease/phosphatase family metal-dependent hydrolase